MRSYALLLLACTVLHARAASIPAPAEAVKKLLSENDALDNVSMDNNASEQELVDLPNSIPVENVPVKVIEEQPVIKTIALKENSNDYVPDNDDSTNIKRVEIDLKNPGPPQRQEHDSQNPGFYQDRERAVAAIKQSIAESENIFKRGVQDVTLKFKNYFANNEDLKIVQENIQNLKETVSADLTKLSNTIYTSLKPQSDNPEESVEKIPGITEVENHLKTLETNFNTGVNMLSEGVEILSILKEEDESEALEKISGKADNTNIDAATSAQAGTAPANPTPSSTTPSPAPVFGFLDSFLNSLSNTFTDLGNSIQNMASPNQNQNQNGSNSTSNFNIFPNLNFPNIFQNQQNQNQNQAQGSPPAGAQADDAATTTKPNLIQQFTSNIQNFLNTGNNQQQNPNPFVQASNSFIQSISSIWPWSGQANQQNNQGNTAVVNQPAAGPPAQGSNAVPAADPAQGSNAIPAPQPPQAPQSPPKPVKDAPPESAPLLEPIQQLVQMNPFAQGIANTVQRIQGLSNPSKPRDTPIAENPDSKGHKPGGSNGGDNNISGIVKKSEPTKEEPQTIPEDKNDNNISSIVKKSEPVKEEPQTITEVKNDEQGPVAEVTKTE